MRDVKRQGIPRTSSQLLSDMMEKGGGEGEENTWHETCSKEGPSDVAVWISACIIPLKSVSDFAELLTSGVATSCPLSLQAVS